MSRARQASRKPARERIKRPCRSARLVAAAIAAGFLAGGFLRPAPQEEDLPNEESPEPLVGDCRNDAETLALQAEDLLSETPRDPPADRLDRARRLYRRARLLDPSPFYPLRAADLAAAAGEEEESVDFLSDALERGAELSPVETLLLARRAEERGDFHGAIAHYKELREALSGSDPALTWIAERLRRLEVEAEAQALTAPVSAIPIPEARLALADARRLMSRGELRQAREKLLLALRLSPGYVEAALALGALETRESRTREAIRAYRTALSGDPGRLEALVSLANLLWDEPDRAAKEESLTLLDQAATERPGLLALLRLSAVRWSQWGDAAKALERLDAFRAKVSPEERRETETLRESLLRRAAETPAGEGETEAGELPDFSSPAVEPWKKAQIYFRRGDQASLLAALDHLGQAERLDPTFGRAAELAAAIHAKRGEPRLAEEALRRAILADPSRATAHERLAFLLMRQSGRAAEAEEAWRRAEEAGSQEALFYLGEAAERAGKRSLAANLYRRYLDASPGGVHASEAQSRAARLHRRARAIAMSAATLLALLAFAGGIFLYRRRSGLSFEEWLARDPDRAREARPIVGRLRHEAVKHGGLLLRDAAVRLKASGVAARQETAALLVSRFFGSEDSERRSLVAESFQALSELRELAREDGYRLNLRYRDPVFSPLIRGLELIRDAERGLRRVEEEAAAVPEGAAVRAASLLERAALSFESVSGVLLDRVLDSTASTPVRFDDLARILSRVAAEKRVAAPPLEPLGVFHEAPSGSFSVRVPPGDWETIWRNLFANAVVVGAGEGGADLRLALSAERSRDPVTGEAFARFLLADNLSARLTTEMIRGQAADRGWGIVADLVRRNGGAVDVSPPPDSSYVKGILIELPALESQ